MLNTMEHNMNIDELQKVHCIGIGGIGVSALARMFCSRGVVVSGSDTALSEITAMLEEKGVCVHEGHDAKNVPEDVELVVYSPAVGEGNPEYDEAKHRDVPLLSYPEVLGLLSKIMKTIAVSGTHGKTTTTAMIAHIALKAGLSPTVIAGSLMHPLPEYGVPERTNFIAGESDIFIVEACEYKRSFLALHPDILVITNIEEDHLDYYTDLADIQSAFSSLVSQMKEGGCVVCRPKETAIAPVVKDAEDIDYGTVSMTLSLKVLGKYNEEDARAAVAPARALGVSEEAAIQALADFPGTWRRGEYKGLLASGAKIYDDYAHHPTEIRSTLAGFREAFPDARITVVFQPHLYSRTKLLMDDFAKSFDNADTIIVADIYAAREKDDGTIHARDLVESIQKEGGNALYGGNLTDITESLSNKEYTDNNIIITMGAGDVYVIGESLLV
jgi:UDP-N-acetylmuramate--alanine ligase